MMFLSFKLKSAPIPGLLNKCQFVFCIAKHLTTYIVSMRDIRMNIRFKHLVSQPKPTNPLKDPDP